MLSFLSSDHSLTLKRLGWYISNPAKMNILPDKKIRELTHGKLKKSREEEGYIHNITVREGKVAVDCRGIGVMLFDICHSYD